MIVAYNGKDNEPILGDVIPKYSKIDELSSWGCVPHDTERNDFLSTEKNAESFDQEIK